MTKDKLSESEVRQAVRDYLDKLINERQNAGGMAVNRTDLMVASNNVGYKTSHKDAELFLDTFVRPGMKLLKSRPEETRTLGNYKRNHTKNATDPTDAYLVNPQLKIQPVKLNLNKVPTEHVNKVTLPITLPFKRTKNHHWLTWKMSPSPAPPPITKENKTENQSEANPVPDIPEVCAPTKDPCTPAPPQQPEEPAQQEAKCDSPITQPPEKDLNSDPKLQSHDPNPTVADRIPSALVFHKTPAPAQSPIPIQYTAPASRNGAASPCPYVKRPVSEFNPDTYDQLSSPAPLDIPQTEFGPALQSWASGADNYERQVAYNLLKALNGNRSVTPNHASINKHVQRMRARSASPRGRPVSQHKRFGNKVASNSKRPFIPLIPTQQDGFLSDRQPDPAMYSYGYNRRPQTEPRHNIMTQRPLQKFDGKDYIHEGSMFAKSMGPFRNHFVINPEWVSEPRSMQHLTRWLSSRQARNCQALQNHDRQYWRPYQT